MNEKSKKDEEMKITNWEYVDPIKLIKAIDDTMKKIEPIITEDSDDLIEHVYNLYYLIRSNMLLIKVIMNFIGKDEIEKVMKDDCKSLYT